MLISIISVIVVFSMLILSHELGHFIMAKRMGVRVETFSLGFGPKIWSVKRGDTEYALSAIPLGGYIKMAGEEPGVERTGAEWEFSSKPVYKRFNIVVAGALFNYITGFILFCMVFMAGAPVPTSRIGRILEGYPAEKAGLQENDKILAIDGKDVRYWEDVIEILHKKKEGEATELSVDRDGRALSFALTGKSEDQKDIFGRPIKISLLGIGQSDDTEHVRHGFVRSVEMGARTTLNITTMTYKAVWFMLTGALSVKEVSGPIGIFALTGKFAQKGIVHLLWISAVISVSLAIFNLLPFPILDGGHVLFLAIEKIRRRQLDAKVQDRIQQVAFTLLIAFVLLVSWNDVTRFFVK
ncbi:MAG: RIP metalloprotease RseP [Candidatus Omnitrophica bacterium]|nr:RIP metalloprotease RseP [Candidatus Omnitrophota bacterium]